MYTSDKDELFCSKLDDVANLCYTRQKPYFLPFLSERRQALAEKYLKSIYFENFCFFGGYDKSERKMLAMCYDDSEPEFPISALEFRYRNCDKLTHRDFLGALMSLGIERETVGDILVEDGKTVVFIKSELKDYIFSQISKIGNVGVKIYDADLTKLPKGRGTEEFSLVVSSLRLDNIVAAVTGLSREKTKSLILTGNVSLNYIQTMNISQSTNVGDVLIIRGKGKYILNAVMGETKKGRIRISLIHYR
ncbi:MAG: RNA-binding protein [Ruminococcus sp.]